MDRIFIYEIWVSVKKVIGFFLRISEQCFLISIDMSQRILNLVIFLLFAKISNKNGPDRIELRKKIVKDLKASWHLIRVFQVLQVVWITFTEKEDISKIFPRRNHSSFVSLWWFCRWTCNATIEIHKLI